MAIAIQNCPFCGSSHNHINHHQMTFYVVCQHCLSTGPRRREIDQSIEQWNALFRQLKQAQQLKHQRDKKPETEALSDILARLNHLERLFNEELHLHHA
jgi:transcription elongation factor Elf1